MNPNSPLRVKTERFDVKVPAKPCESHGTHTEGNQTGDKLVMVEILGGKYGYYKSSPKVI